MAPFRKGLIQNVALCNHGVGIWHLFKAAGPLLIGTILEYGEWNLLTLFIRHLGPAEGKPFYGMESARTTFAKCFNLQISNFSFAFSNSIAATQSLHGLCWDHFGTSLKL